MISFSSTGFGYYAPVGPLVLYSLLFFFTAILFYCRQSSINHTVSLTLIVAALGIIYASCLLVESLGNSIRLSRILSPFTLFFGLSVVPITWTVGINSFSILFSNKKPLQVKAAIIITWLIMVLITLCTAYYSSYLKPTRADIMYTDLYKTIATFKTLVFFEWVYFFLFSSLLIKSKYLVTTSTFNSLVIFSTLNTVRLIVDTFYLKSKNSVDEVLALYVQFFLTDPMTVISLFISIIYLNNLKSISSEKHINK